MNGRNSLFLHLMCWDIQYSRELVDNMLKSIFMHDPYLQYIAFIKSVFGCLRMFIFFLFKIYESPFMFSDVVRSHISLYV